MDKEKIVNQLQQKMQKTYLHTEVLDYYDCLALKVEGEVIAGFRGWDPDHYFMECGPELTEWALSNRILLEFYEAGRKLLRKPIKKYAIRVLKGETVTAIGGYLNVNYQANLVAFADKVEIDDWRTSFTEKEIEELKNRDDIAVDWDKVELEEVDDE